MIPVRQSTAFETAIGPVLDADGAAVTDCVVGDFKIKKTTGNFAALNGSATLTHVSAGFYDLVLTTSDTDTVGTCCIAIDDTTNACSPLYLQVVEEAVYDMLFASSALGYIANAPVNVAQISGDSTAADNAESFFDGTGYAGTNNVIPTVTTLTNAPSDSSGVTTLLSRIGGAITISGGRVDANVTYFGGSAGTFSGGRPEVNATHWGGTAVASATVGANVVSVGGNAACIVNIVDVYDTSFTNAWNGVDGMWYADLRKINGNSVDYSSGTFDFDSLQTAYTAVNTNLDATISSRSTVTTAQVNAEVDTALADINLDHLVKNAVDTNFATTVHLDSVVGHLADAGTTATFDRTTDALEVLGAATAPSAATIAGAVWNEALSGHLSAGSTGEALNAAGSAGDPWTTTLPGSYTGSQAGKILADILVDTGTTLDGLIQTVDTVVDAIKVKTDYLPSATAGAAGGVFIAGSNAATTVNITGNITGNLSGSVGSISGITFPTNFGSTVISVGGVVSADTVAVSGDATAADNLESYLDGTNFMPVDAHKPVFNISGATLTVKKPDGTTTAYTRTLTTSASADPVTGSS